MSVASNSRLRELRDESVYLQPSLTDERAILVTEFYQSSAAQQASIPVQRALAFKHILAHKHLHVSPGEWIVGERGPEPKATPTYPEICTHSLEDLDVLDTRKRIPYRVPAGMRETYRDQIIPFWRGRSMRDRVFREMAPE